MLYVVSHMLVIQGENFVKSARAILPNLTVSDHDLKCLFQEYLMKLELLTEDSIIANLTSMSLLSSLMSSKDKHYRNIELILYVLMSAAVSTGVESIVKSWVSLYEYHCSNIRPISDDKAQN